MFSKSDLNLHLTVTDLARHERCDHECISRLKALNIFVKKIVIEKTRRTLSMI